MDARWEHNSKVTYKNQQVTKVKRTVRTHIGSSPWRKQVYFSKFGVFTVVLCSTTEVHVRNELKRQYTLITLFFPDLKRNVLSVPWLLSNVAPIVPSPLTNQPVYFTSSESPLLTVSESLFALKSCATAQSGVEGCEKYLAMVTCTIRGWIRSSRGVLLNANLNNRWKHVKGAWWLTQS